MNLILFLFSISMLNVQTVKEKCTIDTIKRKIKITSFISIICFIILDALCSYAYYMIFKKKYNDDSHSNLKIEEENKELKNNCIEYFFKLSVITILCGIADLLKSLNDKKLLQELVDKEQDKEQS